MLEIGISIWFFIRLSLLVNGAPGCERRSLADFQSACQSGRAVSFAYPTYGGERCCWCLALFIASGSCRGGRNKSAGGFVKRIYMAVRRMTMGLIVGNRGTNDHMI